MHILTGDFSSEPQCSNRRMTVRSQHTEYGLSLPFFNNQRMNFSHKTPEQPQDTQKKKYKNIRSLWTIMELDMLTHDDCSLLIISAREAVNNSSMENIFLTKTAC